MSKGYIYMCINKTRQGSDTLSIPLFESKKEMRFWGRDLIIGAFQIPSTKNLRLGQGQYVNRCTQ